MHIDYSRSDEQHALADKLSGILSACFEHWPRKVRCAELYVGQVSGTLSSIMFHPIFTKDCQTCGREAASYGPEHSVIWILLILVMLHGSQVI
jgi:hypothetical protein